MALKITKKSIKEAARSSKISGFTLKEIETSLEHDAIEALKSSGIKNGTYSIKETGLRGEASIDSKGNMKIKTKRKNKGKS